MYITKKDRITTNQAMVSITSTTLGAGILIMPRVILNAVGLPEAWITLLAGGLLTLCAMILMIKLAQKFPNKTLFEYASIIIGKPIGSVFCIFFCIYLLITASYEIRVLGEVITFYILEGTPMWAITIPIMLVSFYLLQGGINSLVRLFQIVFPVTILVILIVYGLSFTMFDLNHFKPFLIEGTAPLFEGLIPSFNSLAGFELAAVYIAYMSEPNKAVKAFSLGLGVAIFIYVLSLVLVVGALSTDVGMFSTWSVIDLMRNFELKGFIFERIESLFLIVWVMQIFSAFSSMYYGSSLALATVIQYKKRPIIIALLPVCYIIAMMPRNINDITFMGKIISYIVIFMFIMFILLCITYLFRKNKIKGIATN